MSVFFSVLGKKGKQNKQKNNLTKSKLGCAWKGNKKKKKLFEKRYTVLLFQLCNARDRILFFFVLGNHVFVSEPVLSGFFFVERVISDGQSTKSIKVSKQTKEKTHN